MMTRQARRPSAIQHDTVRCGFLSQRSYVAPSPRSHTAPKWPRKELTYCPIYGFKSCVICTKDLTPELFEGLGEALGRAIRFIVDMLSGVLGAMADAIDDFLQGMARAIGMDVSIFSIILLIIGLLFLFSGARSLLRGSIIGGVIWLFLGLIVMGWLIR